MPDWPSTLFTPSEVAITTMGNATMVGDAGRVSLGGLGNVAWPAASRAIFVAVLIESPVIVKQIGWENGATVSGNIDVGIYDYNGTLLVSSGTTGQTPVSVPQFANITDTPLTPGHYFMAMALDNATGIVVRYSSADIQQLRVLGVQQMASAFVLPATATFANPASAYVPHISLLCQATA